MIRSRHPEHIIAAQTPVTAENILQCIIQGVAHMQDTGNIRRGDYDGIT